MPANNRKNPFLLAPALTLVVLVLLLVFGFLEGEGGAKTLILVMIFTVIAFAVPLVAHPVLRGVPMKVIFPLRKLKKSEVLLSLACVFTLIFVTAALKFGIFGMEYEGDVIALYGFTLAFPESFGEGVLLLLAIAVVPAFCEEFLFRGVMFYEYRLMGVLGSALVSSVLAALLGLSFSAFPMLFFAAFVFALVRFLTGNLLPAVLVHIGFGVYSLFMEKYIYLMASSSESRVLFWFLLIILLGVSLVWMLHQAEAVLRERAASADVSPVLAPKGKMPIILYDMATAPSLWMLLCVFLVTAIIRIFV